MSQDERVSKAADLVRKVLTVGVGAVFLTEESLRSMVSEFKLPKELLAGILESAGRTKTEFLQKLSSDILERVTQRIEPTSLINELIAKHDLEFQVTLRFKPKKEPKPS